jgi:hypothetical protein
MIGLVGMVRCSAAAWALCPVAWTYWPMDWCATRSLGQALEVVEVTT